MVGVAAVAAPQAGAGGGEAGPAGGLDTTVQYSAEHYNDVPGLHRLQCYFACRSSRTPAVGNNTELYPGHDTDLHLRLLATSGALLPQFAGFLPRVPAALPPGSAGNALRLSLHVAAATRHEPHQVGLGLSVETAVQVHAAELTVQST